MPSDPALPPRVRAFLQRPLFMSVATADDDGAPRQAVAWYDLTDDDRILLNSRMPRRWCTNLLRDGRTALAVIDPEDGYRWVGLTGVVEEVVDADVERAREDIVALAHRYHPGGPDPRELARFRSEPRVTFLVRVTAIHDHLED